MIRIALSRPTDWQALGERWRTLEDRADGSFFQSWTWMGCLAKERFPNPVLLEAIDGRQTVALGLFNQSRRRLRPPCLHLGESGDPALDSPFTEYNGLLVCRDQAPDTISRCWRMLRREPIAGQRPWLPRPLVMSGVGEDSLAAVGDAGWRPRITARRSAWWVDLQRVREAGGQYLAGLSANTRAQIRRSDRSYDRSGPLEARAATTMTETLAYFDELRMLHQSSWIARGQPGAFAVPFFNRFHRALIEHGLPRGEIELLRITAGERLVGLLYNFRWRGAALAYQSGFDYVGASRQEKPGLTAHHVAIERALAAGMESYDLLAGDDRYKRSLTDRKTPLYWLAGGAGWIRYAPR